MRYVMWILQGIYLWNLEFDNYVTKKKIEGRKRKTEYIS